MARETIAAVISENDSDNRITRQMVMAINGIIYPSMTALNPCDCFMLTVTLSPGETS